MPAIRFLDPVLLLALVVSACQPTVGEAKQQFCDSLNQLDNAADKLNAVDANTSIDEAKQAQKEIEQAWKAVKDASKTLKGVQLDASEKAYQSMMQSLNKAISGETTLGDSAKLIVTGAQQLKSELKVINTTVCGIK